ncbi:uncharacterized protein LOC121838037 [Ixodes scapularis]|uniref:uncharacterized protein LOC121838037 n=1 Tax=Ixodes scapularis TaxID=6945 RepID=UPI001C382FE8|nr:uncharacterized protein LOC121838037 [Ixodes scapularis]
MCVTETWLHDGILDCEFTPPNYNVVRCDRSSRGGGVALFFKSGISFSVLPCLPNTESLWCKVQLDKFVLVIGAVYRAPSSGLQTIFDIYDYIHKYNLANFRLILLGDFNAPDINWETLVVGCRDRDICDALVDIAVSFDLDQVVKTCTRDNSVLDLVFLTHSIANLGYDCEVVEGISDHKAVLVSLNIRVKRSNPEFVTFLDFNRADDVSIIDELSFYFDDFCAISLDADVNTLLRYFNSLIEKCINKFVPVTRKKKNPAHPWITREVLQLMRQTKRRRRSTKDNTESVVHTSFEYLKTTLKEKMLTAKTKYFNVTLSEFMKSNPAKFWRSIIPRCSVSQSFTIEGESVSEPTKIANCFNDYFKSVFSRDNGNDSEFFFEGIYPALSDLEISIL